VQNRLRRSWNVEIVRWLVPAATLVLCLGFDAAAAASSAYTSRVTGTENHAHNCKCAAHCQGESCCCGPRKIVDHNASLPPAATLALSETNPCLNSAPCGEPGMPNSPSARIFDRAAFPASRIAILAARALRFLPSCSRCILPARRPTRLDKPPKPSAVA
jgi:hypothetical protein